MQLLQNVTSTVNEVCKRLKSEEKPREIKPGRVVPCSVAAVKNGRRKMEDRHVVIHDVNIIFEDSSKEVRGIALRNLDIALLREKKL